MPEQQSEEALPEERDMAVVTVVDDSQTENTVHAEAPVSGKFPTSFYASMLNSDEDCSFVYVTRRG
jgi:hypothetical protein